MEFAAALDADDAGKLPTFLVGWSGRVDPDANIHQFHTCQGSLNTTQACDEAIDSLLNKAREVSDLKERAELYRQASTSSPARAQRHLPLPSELHRRLPEEPQGLQGGARRADPHQGRELELA